MRRNVYSEPKTLVCQSTQRIVRSQLPTDRLPRTLQNLCLEEKHRYDLKSFRVTSGFLSIRVLDDFDQDDNETEKVKKGIFKVFCEDRKNLFVIHSEWFEKPFGQDLLEILKDQPWIKKEDKIHLDRGYIGVLELEHVPETEESFEEFYWQCADKIDRDEIAYVSEKGVVTDGDQGKHSYSILKNKNGETIGIWVNLESSGYSSDEDSSDEDSSDEDSSDEE